MAVRKVAKEQKIFDRNMGGGYDRKGIEKGRQVRIIQVSTKGGEKEKGGGGLKGEEEGGAGGVRTEGKEGNTGE